MITDRTALAARNRQLAFEIRCASPFTVDDGQVPPVPVNEWLVYKLHEQEWSCRTSLEMGADQLTYNIVEKDVSVTPPTDYRLHIEAQENRIGMNHPVELWATLTKDNGDTETQRVFAGKHFEVDPQDDHFAATCHAWSTDLATTDCDLFMESDTTGSVLELGQRLVEVPGFDEGYDDGGTDRFFTFGLDPSNMGQRPGFGTTYGLGTPVAVDTGAGGLPATDYRYMVTIVVSHDGYEKEVWPSAPSAVVNAPGRQVTVTCTSYSHPVLGRLRYRWYRWIDGVDPWADGALHFIGTSVGNSIVDSGIVASAGTPPFVRRAFQKNVMRLFYLVKGKLATDPDGLVEVSGTYFIDDETGLVQFGEDPRLFHDHGPDNDPNWLVPADPEYLAFYLKGIRCYIEGTNNAIDVIRAIMEYPTINGGFGADADYLLTLATIYDMTSTAVLQTQDMDLFQWQPKNGTAQDALKAIQKALRPNFRYFTDHSVGDRGRFRAEYIIQKTVPGTGARAYDIELLRLLAGGLKVPKVLANIYTRVKMPFTKERPVDWIKDSEMIYLLEPGVLLGAQTVSSTQMLAFHAGENHETALNEIWRVRDNDPNTGFGSSDLPNSGLNPFGETYEPIRSAPATNTAYGYVAWGIFDLNRGAAWGDASTNRDLGELVFYGGGSRNPKSLDAGPGIFSTGARIWAARAEDVANAGERFNKAHYRIISQEAVRDDLRTNGESGREMRVKNLVVPRARLLYVEVKAFKHTVAQQTNPAAMCHLFSAYEPTEGLITVQIQNTDPAGEFYYPELLQKMGGRHRTLTIPEKSKLGGIAALIQAKRYLHDAIRNYQSGSAATIHDPMMRPGVSFRFQYGRRNIDSTALALTVTHSRKQTDTGARDYLAGTLSGE